MKKITALLFVIAVNSCGADSSIVPGKDKIDNKQISLYVGQNQKKCHSDKQCVAVMEGAPCGDWQWTGIHNDDMDMLHYKAIWELAIVTTGCDPYSEEPESYCNDTLKLCSVREK